MAIAEARAERFDAGQLKLATFTRPNLLPSGLTKGIILKALGGKVNIRQVRRTTLRIVAAFAGLGFLVPGLLMAWGAIRPSSGSHSYGVPFLLYFCPPMILAMGFESASTSGINVGMLVIAAINAILIWGPRSCSRLISCPVEIKLSHYPRTV